MNKQTVAVGGRKAQLICNLTNDVDAPSSKVEWYKDGDVPVKEVKSHMLIYNHNDMTQSVLYDPVNYADSGEYTCIAYSDSTFYAQSSMQLTVECKCVVL